MEIVSQVAVAMQAVFGTTLDILARTTGCVQRQRKFSGMSLLRTLVLTLLYRPGAKDRDYRATAARLNVFVTEEAIAHRFTDGLVQFLAEALKHTVCQALAAKPLPATLLLKFTELWIGDSTTLSLPDELAKQFPGCGGSEKAGKAAMKIQVLWSLKTGQLLQWLIESGRASDAKSEIAATVPPAGSLSILDLGYFSLERFRRIEDAKAYWISRFQHNTKVFDETGKQLSLLRFLQEHGENGLVDMPVVLGEKDRLPCRLIALRVPPEVAARRRQQACEKARDHGRQASQEYLNLLEWTIFLTNCPPELLSWKEVVVLYRARWQIELLFKLWKSHNRLAQREVDASPQRQMAVLYAKLIGVIVQHWILLTATWSDGQRSLRKAAAVVQDWIVLFSEVLDDLHRLGDLLYRLQAAIANTARVTPRKKHPSLFQLLENPELLEYTVC
ncbi:MAG: IS4 family transposase [Planctomycetota bacterium]